MMRRMPPTCAARVRVRVQAVHEHAWAAPPSCRCAAAASVQAPQRQPVLQHHTCTPARPPPPPACPSGSAPSARPPAPGQRPPNRHAPPCPAAAPPACMPATASSKPGITEPSPRRKRKKSFSSPVKAPPLGCGRQERRGAAGGRVGQREVLLGARQGAAPGLRGRGAAGARERRERGSAAAGRRRALRRGRRGTASHAAHLVAGLERAAVVADGHARPVHHARLALLRRRPAADLRLGEGRGAGRQEGRGGVGGEGSSMPAALARQRCCAMARRQHAAAAAAASQRCLPPQPATHHLSIVDFRDNSSLIICTHPQVKVLQPALALDIVLKAAGRSRQGRAGRGIAEARHDFGTATAQQQPLAAVRWC